MTDAPPAAYAHLFTSRSGGHSRAPYEGLNLGDHVGDDPAMVAANRDLVERGLAPLRGRTPRLVFMDQTHSAVVATVTRPPVGRIAADGLVTNQPGLALAVVVADCVPLLLADPVNHVIAAVHCGRVGTLAGIVDAALDAALRLGAQLSQLRAHLGPSIGGCCYELDPATRAAFATVLPAAAATTTTGRPSISVAAGVTAALMARSVRHIDASNVCTHCGPDYFSYRRNHRTGRQAGIIYQ